MSRYFSSKDITHTVWAFRFVKLVVERFGQCTCVW